MELTCKTCGEAVSGLVKESVEAAMARHQAKRHAWWRKQVKKA
jgi:hypothetical protein